MPPIKHALLGASAAHRWLECTPSAVWEAKLDEYKANEAAEEGTLAHEIAETHLAQLMAGEKPKTTDEQKAHRLYKPVMEDYVGVYTDYVMEHLTEARVNTPDALLMQEQRVDFSMWVPGGFGTTDCLLISDDTLHVFDLKYGKGVPVSAVNNPQIRLYAAGAYHAYILLYDIQYVTVHIVQPRLDSITSETIDVEKLLQWADLYVKPRAIAAAEGRGNYVPGEHCRFCKAQPQCRAYAEEMLKLDAIRCPEGTEVPPQALTPQEISDILNSVDGLTRWAKTVKDFAMEQALQGKAFPGYKVVAGRSNRKIIDEDAALARLKMIGITSDRVTKLVGLTDLEEIVGKARLAGALEGLIVKPEGKPTLVKESDKREALDLNTVMFTTIED